MSWLVARSSGAPGRRRLRAGDAHLDALMAVLAGDYAAAEQVLSALVERDSSGVDAYLALARLFRMRGEIGRAIRVHQNLLLRRDLDAKARGLALAELAADYAQGGFLRRAISAYEEVVEHEPRNEHALSELVRLLADAGDHAGAIARAKRLAKVRRSPDPRLESELLCRLARSCQASGETDAARKAAKRAARRDPNNPQAHLVLGQIEAERGRNKPALECWKAALVAARAAHEDEAGALEDEIYLRLEATFSALEQSEDFAVFVRGHLAEQPHDAHALLALARHCASHGEASEAVGVLEKLLGADPGNVEAHVALGRILLAEHRDDEIAKHYGDVLRMLERGAERLNPEELS